MGVLCSGEGDREGVELLSLMADLLLGELRSRRSFEVVQAYMHRFLKVRACVRVHVCSLAEWVWSRVCVCIRVSVCACVGVCVWCVVVVCRGDQLKSATGSGIQPAQTSHAASPTCYLTAHFALTTAAHTRAHKHTHAHMRPPMPPQIHADTIMATPQLRAAARVLRSEQADAMRSLSALVQENLCLVQFLTDLQV
jgi:hypothetical protein